PLRHRSVVDGRPCGAAPDCGPDYGRRATGKDRETDDGCQGLAEGEAVTRAPERGQRRLTVRDIARAAGVSVATVSRAFARPSDVSTETRQRVLKVADQLGYRFNSLAVDFRRGRSRTVVVLVGDITNPFFSEFYKGIEEE